MSAEWISVEDELPKTYDIVVCKCREDYDQTGYYIESRDWGDEEIAHIWKSVATDKFISVIAWLPLPKYEFEDEL